MGEAKGAQEWGYKGAWEGGDERRLFLSSAFLASLPMEQPVCNAVL